MVAAMRRTLGIFLVFGALALVIGCQKAGALKVETVEPPQGTVGGGEEITIIGDGFQPGKTQAEVRFGRRKAENVIIASTSKIKVITPAGDKGPVDVTVAFDDGRYFKLKDGFRYLEPADNEAARKAFFSGSKSQDKIEVEKK